MSDPVSPYQTPQAPPPSMPPQYPAMMAKPTAATVFGILDIVIAAYGVFGIIMILVQVLFLGNLLSSNPALKSSASLYQNSGAMLASGLVNAVITVPLAIAGIKLLKGRRNAITWSNRYSACSILGKVVTTGISIVYIAPQMQAALKAAPLPMSSFSPPRPTFVRRVWSG